MLQHVETNLIQKCTATCIAEAACANNTKRAPESRAMLTHVRRRRVRRLRHSKCESRNQPTEPQEPLGAATPHMPISGRVEIDESSSDKHFGPRHSSEAGGGGGPR